MENMGIVEIARMTEDDARSFLERIRWRDGVACPHCGVVGDSTLMQGKAHRKGLYQCNSCREQFTVTTGTIMHRSRLSLVKWVLAFHLMCSSKKGISALQLQRQLNIASYQTAWHLCHRVRYAMENGPLAGKLGENGGTVEADETYVGGKARRGVPSDDPRHVPVKTPVVALIDRELGRARAIAVAHVDADTLKTIMREHVDKSARVMTDDAPVYDWTDAEFAGHKTTTHSKDEFSRRERAEDGSTIHVHSNTAESFFSLLKRGHIGSFHKWSPRHLHRYCSEFGFRWTWRRVSDFERTVKAIEQGDGVRLTYSALPSESPWQ